MAVAILLAIAVPAAALGDDPGPVDQDSASAATPPEGFQLPAGADGPAGSSDATSPAQVDASQDAYADANAGQSRQLLEDKFTDQLSNIYQTPGRLLDPDDYEKFFSDTVARVILPDRAEPQILISTSPLREQGSDGTEEPIDLDVEDQGARLTERRTRELTSQCPTQQPDSFVCKTRTSVFDSPLQRRHSRRERISMATRSSTTRPLLTRTSR